MSTRYPSHKQPGAVVPRSKDRERRAQQMIRGYEEEVRRDAERKLREDVRNDLFTSRRRSRPLNILWWTGDR